MSGGRPIRIAILGDSKDFETAADRAARKASDLESSMDDAGAAARTLDDRMAGVGDGADTLASKGQQAAGALAGLGEVVGGPVGGAMVGLGSAFQIAADSGDLLNAAVEGGGKLWTKTVGFVQALTKAETYSTLAKQAGAAAQWALNAAMSANPIVLIVLAIAALVAGLIWFFTQTEVGRKAWATFTAFLTAAWAKVSAFMSRVWASIVGFFTGAASTVSKTWTTVSTWFSELPGKILAFFASIPTKLGEIGKNLITGLWNGINDKIAWIREKISGFVKSVEGWFRDFFGIHSPSRLTRGLGRWLPAGLAEGILDGAGLVDAAWAKVSGGFTAPEYSLSASGGRGGSAGIYIAPGAIVVQSLNPDAALGRLVVSAIRDYERSGGMR